MMRSSIVTAGDALWQSDQRSSIKEQESGFSRIRRSASRRHHGQFLQLRLRATHFGRKGRFHSAFATQG